MAEAVASTDAILRSASAFTSSGELSLHRELSHWLVETLESDAVVDGTRVPSERQLAEALQVSRMTVRRALEYVTGEGLIHREVGSRIWRVRKRPRIEINVAHFSGFTSQLLESGLEVGTSTVTFEERNAHANEATEFGVTEQDTVSSVMRVRNVTQEPVLLERFTIPTSIAPNLGKEDLTGSIYQVLREKYKVRLGKVWHRILASSLQPDEAELLGRRPGMAVLRLHRRTFNAEGSLVELADDILCSDRLSVITESEQP